MVYGYFQPGIRLKITINLLGVGAEGRDVPDVQAHLLQLLMKLIKLYYCYNTESIKLM